MTTRNTPNKRTLDQRDAQDDDNNKPNNANLAQYEPAEKRQRLAEDTLHEKVCSSQQHQCAHSSRSHSCPWSLILCDNFFLLLLLLLLFIKIIYFCYYLIGPR